jgi:hypothetical protein
VALPEARAAFLKEALQSFHALGAGRDASAFARLPEQVPRDILRARPLDWLPAGHALAILRAIEAEGGLDGVRRCSAATIERVFGSPLLRAFLDAALGVLGAGPEPVLRSAAIAWPLHYRNAGELVVTRSAPAELRVLHPGIPDVLRAPCWLASLATCIGRIAGLAADGATAEPRDVGGRIVYVVRW